MSRYLLSTLLFTFAFPLCSSAATVVLPGRPGIVPLIMPALPIGAPLILPTLPVSPAGPAILPGKTYPLPIYVPTRLPFPLSRPTPIKVATAIPAGRVYSAAGPIDFLFDWSHLDDDQEGLEDAGALVPVGPKPGPRPPVGAAKQLIFSNEKASGGNIGSGLFDGSGKRETLKVLAPVRPAWAF